MQRGEEKEEEEEAARKKEEGDEHVSSDLQDHRWRDGVLPTNPSRSQLFLSPENGDTLPTIIVIDGIFRRYHHQ